MAQEIDLIFETLREIKKANANSSESFERLLTGIVSKVEQVDKNAMSTEFIKSYMAEISKGADERYNVALTKFSDLEKALTARSEASAGSIMVTLCRSVSRTLPSRVRRTEKKRCCF